MSTGSAAPNWNAQVKEWVQLVCLMEATARKPGNVHPGASFVDLGYNDFVAAAARIAPFLSLTPRLGVGRAIFSTVDITCKSAASNVNLGIVLLLAPLTAVPPEMPLADGIGEVLEQLEQQDAQLVYEAIKIARPSGMGKVAKEDVSGTPTGTLREVMQLAADRDLVAAQYANGYRTVLNEGVPFLNESNDFPTHWDQGVIRLQLMLMSKHPDSLIARKVGVGMAKKSAELAQSILDAGWPDTPESQTQIKNFDKWLRADGNRRNPGTTADVVTACLFAAIRDGQITPPSIDEVKQKGSV